MTRHNLDKLSLYDSDVHASDAMFFFSNKFEKYRKETGRMATQVENCEPVDMNCDAI